jgi:hypothetical protein
VTPEVEAVQKANYETQCVIRVGWGRGGSGDIRGILFGEIDIVEHMGFGGGGEVAGT